MYVRKVKKTREREFAPRFAVVNGEGEVTSLFRRLNGAETTRDAFNKTFTFAGPYKVIEIEEAR